MNHSIIRSRHNATVKRLHALLRNARDRQQEQRTVLEGVHLAQAWLQQGLPIELIVVAESAFTNAEVQALLTPALRQQCVVLDDAIAAQMSLLESGADIFLLVQSVQASLEQFQQRDCVVLEAVQDPGNVGSILRSALAAGVTNALLGAGCASAWAPRTLRAGMGAQCAMKIIETPDLLEALQSLQTPVLATTLQAPQTLYAADLRLPLAWVFGNEGQGVSSALLSVVNKTVTIPQNPAIESLNVAAAAAVCLFEMRRQRLNVVD